MRLLLWSPECLYADFSPQKTTDAQITFPISLPGQALPLNHGMPSLKLTWGHVVLTDPLGSLMDPSQHMLDGSHLPCWETGQEAGETLGRWSLVLSFPKVSH